MAITGQAKKRTHMKESSRQGRETVEELSGGPMEAGTRAYSRTVFSVDTAPYIEREDKRNTKECGKEACSMAKAPNSSTMDRDIKATSRRTSSTDKESSTRMIRLFMVFGKIISCLSLIWSSPSLVRSELGMKLLFIHICSILLIMTQLTLNNTSVS